MDKRRILLSCVFSLLTYYLLVSWRSSDYTLTSDTQGMHKTDVAEEWLQDTHNISESGKETEVHRTTDVQNTHVSGLLHNVTEIGDNLSKIESPPHNNIDEERVTSNSTELPLFHDDVTQLYNTTRDVNEVSVSETQTLSTVITSDYSSVSTFTTPLSIDNGVDRSKSNETVVPNESLTDKEMQININNIYYHGSQIQNFPKTKETIDCAAIFRQNRTAIKKAMKRDEQEENVRISDKQYAKMASNCTEFIHTRGYLTYPVNAEESSFSIAYSITAYHELEATERLLRAIYRPQNYYCVHVDVKASSEFKRGMAAVTSCFKNVFLSSRSVDIVWGGWSLLEAELICMEDLLKYPKWDYHLNLAGEEFPLKTNLEMVQILKAFNGSNLMEAMPGEVNNQYKYRYEFSYKDGVKQGRKTDSPIEGNVIKGSFLVAMCRAFVQYVMTDTRSQKYTEWLKDTLIPDEMLFATLNFNPSLGAPGAYRGWPGTTPDYPYLVRYIVWSDSGQSCAGKYVREVCIFAPGDLYRLYDSPHMFFNKFHLDYYPSAYSCMEQLLLDRTREEIRTGHVRQNFNISYYQQFEFTWNHN